MIKRIVIGNTIIERIIKHNTGMNQVKPGDIITVNVDHVMIHDIFVPFVAEKFEKMGFTKLWDSDRIMLIYDHLVPTSQLNDMRRFRMGDTFAAGHGIKNMHRSNEICHQLTTEAGHAKSRDVVFSTNSHTITYGCMGAFSSGVGYTEMTSILGAGAMWIKIPETVRVVIDGTLPEGMMSKDVILRLVGNLGADGATYRALEFSGSMVESVAIANRVTVANMAIEAGTKCALFTPNEKTEAYCGIKLDEYQKSLTGDGDAVYVRIIVYKAQKFEPVMACPSQVDKTKPTKELRGTPTDQVFVGSCTNGRLEDLVATAQVLKDREVADYMKLIVTPASRRTYQEAIACGAIETLTEAGAIITHPRCGLYYDRTGGMLSDGERVIAANNRNFLGRMGASKVGIYLASPRTAATYAVAGAVVRPEESA